MSRHRLPVRPNLTDLLARDHFHLFGALGLELNCRPIAYSSGITPLDCRHRNLQVRKVINLPEKAIALPLSYKGMVLFIIT